MIYGSVLAPNFISLPKYTPAFTTNSGIDDLNADVLNTMDDGFDLLVDIEVEAEKTSQGQNNTPSYSEPSQ